MDARKGSAGFGWVSTGFYRVGFYRVGFYRVGFYRVRFYGFYGFRSMGSVLRGDTRLLSLVRSSAG
jgi:hypothetical protein